MQLGKEDTKVISIEIWKEKKSFWDGSYFRIGQPAVSLVIWNFLHCDCRSPLKWHVPIGHLVNIPTDEHLPDDDYKFRLDHSLIHPPDAKHFLSLTNQKIYRCCRQLFQDAPMVEKAIITRKILLKIYMSPFIHSKNVIRARNSLHFI